MLSGAMSFCIQYEHISNICTISISCTYDKDAHGILRS